MSLLPKEHGAYGQFAFPLIAAFSVAGMSTAGWLVAVALAAGFLAHEPATVLRGLRGSRARRELRQPAIAWLAASLALALVAGAGAIRAIAPTARWTLAVPVVPVLLLLVLSARGQEKSAAGETTVSLAFSGAALPVAMAGGAPLKDAAAVAIPFAILFVASTFAVRVVIAQSRRGGDPRAATATRRWAFVLLSASAAVLAATAVKGWLPPSVLAAAAPGLLLAGVIVARPPSPSRLRALGWTLVAASLVTTAIVVATVRH